MCRDEFCSKVLGVYVSGFDLVGLGFDDALRKFLAAFRLPGEAQKIDRIMHAFASQVSYSIVVHACRNDFLELKDMEPTVSQE